MQLGISLWSQGTDWPPLREAALLVDRSGYEYLFTFDHLLANLGDPGLPVHEGWLTLAAWASITRRARLGLLVGANTFRNPALVAKMTATLDHLSGGRSVLGLGSAWFELEHRAYGIEFGRSFRERGEWLLEALDLIGGLLAGETVTSPGPRYRTAGLRLEPAPIQAHVPIVIGGMGTAAIRAVARHADVWSLYTEPDAVLADREAKLARECAELGRDPATILRAVSCKMIIRDDPADARRTWEAVLRHQGIVSYGYEPWLGPPEAILGWVRRYRDLGFGLVVVDLLAPFDLETVERLALEVAPVLRAEATRDGR